MRLKRVYLGKVSGLKKIEVHSRNVFVVPLENDFMAVFELLV